MRSRVDSSKTAAAQTARYADMFAALGTEVRLQILRLLLSAHPDGMVVGEIQSELEIPASTLSHHLEKLRGEGLVAVRRESTFLRYTANTAALEELLGFLFAECCSRSKAVSADAVVRVCDIGPKRRSS
jgi:ArsR family transcriptional regulator, arsenate/arsenite/antimonite-responsive transcriptional repressor